MCGIFGSINTNAVQDTYTGLSRLEYRGYDSFGYAAITEGRINVVKRLGPIDKSAFDRSLGYQYDAAIGHVRWATNGEPTLENAHPQQCEDFYVVHNGVIENAPQNMLDTKWLVNLIELNGGDAEQTYDRVEGDNAFVFINEAAGAVWCVAKGSKRLYVTTNGYVSSDLNALAGFSDEAYLLENECCDLSWVVRASSALPVPPLRSEPNETGEHQMLSEIKEQVHLDNEGFFRHKLFRQKRVDCWDIDIVATGSSLNAGMFGAYALEQHQNIFTRCIHASQAKHRILGKNVVAISQSGETKDIIGAMKESEFTCITNNSYSTLADMSSMTIDLDVGPELAVAATKTFTMSCIKLALMKYPYDTLPFKMPSISEGVYDILERTDEIESIADRIMGYEHFLFLGDRQNYPIALEGALKFKEVAYVHAEGMPSSEMKHGPIALVDHRVPSLFVMTEGFLPESISNIQEIKARKGFVIVIAHDSIVGEFKDIADIVFSCIDTGEQYSQSLVLKVVLQLLSYYIAVRRGINPDRPRNLAKCVTV